MTLRALVVVVLVACGTDPSSPPPARTFGGDRPVDLQVPVILQAPRRYPLVVVLHGYGGTGDTQEAYFGTANEAAGDAGFVLAPDGTTDSMGHQFWNADPTCCPFDDKHPDDVAYLGDLIDKVSAAWPIDPHAVVVLGQDNGATMAYRMACERPDVVSNVIAVAGRATSMPCMPARPVDVLDIHGTADAVVPYGDAVRSVQQWAVADHCATTRALGNPVDLDTNLAGAETLTESTNGCPDGVAVDLWTVEGGGHAPALQLVFDATVRQWFITHRRP
jgi:polyhydroxybutyrate depolymerase